MGKRLIILDFDGTIFKTRDFINDWFAELAKNPRHAQRAISIKKAIYDPTTSDVVELFEDHGLSFDQAQLALNRLNPNNYIYPEMIDFFVEHHGDQIVILTTGHQTWQQVKLNFCKALANFPQQIIPGNKGEYLLKNLQITPQGILWSEVSTNLFDELWLCDDRVEHLTPLAKLTKTHSIKLHHLQRYNARYSQTNPSIPTFEDFTKLNNRDNLLS